jgi:DNA-binding NarL/FixJ family response regulator
MSKTLIACVEDLFFRSKIEATARHLNIPLRFVGASELAKACGDGTTAAVLMDLSGNGDPLAAVRALRGARATQALPVVGFLSHVDKKLAEDAERAGVTQVMPRSQFSETLPDLLMDLLAPGTKREIPEESELPDE